MRISAGFLDKANAGTVIAAAFLAAQLCFFAVYPFRLIGEGIELIRKGVMVDDTACEAAGRSADWHEFGTRRFKVYVEPGVDLAAVDRQLRKRLFFPSQKIPHDAGLETKIAYRLDALCERGMEILDVHPKMRMIGIKIFKSRENLNKAYRILTGNTAEIKAFYSHDCGIIYTSEYGVSDSVIVHEMAHAIVDSYYNGVPSAKVGEMFASYVDMHIAD